MTSLTQPSHRLAALRKVPAFAPVALKLISVLNQDRVNFKEVADLMKSDAGISAEVLRLANAAVIGQRFPTTSILHAVSLIGAQRVAGLTATLCLGKLLKPISNLPLMRRCWRNNLATALIARQWAPEYEIDPEKAYMFGLFAGLGQLVLLTSEPALYSQLAERASHEEIPLAALETETFGFTSREAGAWLVEEWRLPEELLAVFAPGNRSSLAKLICAAGDESVRLGFGVTEFNRFDPQDPASFQVAERLNQFEQELGI